MADIDGYADVLGEAQRRAWEKVAQIAHSRGGVLMGGTAVAVHLRHRFSEDLDIMTLQPCPGALVAMQLGRSFANFHAIDVSDNSCRAIVDGVRVDVFKAPRRISVGPHGMRRVTGSTTGVSRGRRHPLMPYPNPRQTTRYVDRSALGGHHQRPRPDYRP